MVKIIARRIFTTQSKSHSLHQNFPFPPYPSNAIWKTLACFTFQSRGVEIISTQLSVWLWTVTQFNTPKNEMTLMVIFLKIFSVWFSLFVLLFFCNSMPCSGSSTLHGVNPSFKKNVFHRATCRKKES